MRLFLLSAGLLIAACNNPDSLPPVSEDGGAQPPAQQEPAPADRQPQPAPGDPQSEPDESALDDLPEFDPLPEASEESEESGPRDLRGFPTDDNIIEEPMGDLGTADEEDEQTQPADTTEAPVVGGECSYDVDFIDATVVESSSEGATMQGPDGEFFVSSSEVSPVPEVGDVLTLKRERIVDGTCAPEMYTRVGQ